MPANTGLFIKGSPDDIPVLTGDADGVEWSSNVLKAVTARLMVMFDDETTGIGASLVNSEEGKVNSAVYDLQGRRVAQPTKGLYIVDGKKVIVK